MAWSHMPRMEGIRAAKHWLDNLKPLKEAKRRKQFAEFHKKLKAELKHDKKLSTMLQATIDMAHLLGRTDGLREGLDLYQYGLKYEGKSAASRSVMKYVVGNADNPKKLTTKSICVYLDRELDRIDAQMTADASIGPPEAWGCKRWIEAYKKKRNNVDVLFSEARDEARSQKFNTLIAWATWGEKSKPRAQSDTAKNHKTDPKPTKSR